MMKTSRIIMLASLFAFAACDHDDSDIQPHLNPAVDHFEFIDEDDRNADNIGHDGKDDSVEDGKYE